MPHTRKHILKGIVWSLLDTVFRYVMKFFFALAITRILEPRDYGLVAYTGIFMGIAAWLSEGGFGTSLIQKKDANDTDFSTAFLFNFSVTAFFFILYFFSSPALARYFGENELIAIMRVSSINLVLNSLCYIHYIKLIKDIDFKQQTLMNFSTTLISGVIGLSMAVLGYGYWALIIQTLSGTLLRMFGLWYIVRWRPAFIFNFGSFKQQFAFGRNVFIQGLFESVFREIHSAVIGKNYHTTALGNYSRGQKFYDLFIVESGIAINKVLYPAMVRKSQENDHRVNKMIYVNTYSNLFLIVAPLSLFLIHMSGPLAHVLLTDKWIQAVPFMKMYFLAGFIYLLVYFNSITLLSANRPFLYLKMDMVKNSLMALALLLTFDRGINMIIIGWLIAFYVFYLVYELKMATLGYFQKDKYLKLAQVIICLIPQYLVFVLTKSFIKDQLDLLIMNAALQPFVYLIALRLFGFRVYKEFASTIKPIIPRQLRSLF